MVELAPAFAFLVMTGGLVLVMMRAAQWFQESHKRDADTGLVRAGSFAELVGAELSRSMRYDRAFSLIYVRSAALAPETSTLPAVERKRRRAAIAAAVTTTLRSIDLAAEVREGEFAVLMPETDAASVVPVAERIRQALLRQSEGERGPASSMGIVTVADPRIEAQALIGRSRDLMLESGQDGDGAVRHEVLSMAEAAV